VSLADSVSLEIATAEDLRSAMTRAVAMLRRDGGADGVEWWAPTEGGNALRREAAAGVGRGPRAAFQIGPAGALVVIGADWDARLASAITRLVPLVRRRWTEQQLVHAATQLARRNEDLEDFAALVAHELKAPLCDALSDERCPGAVQRALEIVDSLLEASWAESSPDAPSRLPACLDAALRDLGATTADVRRHLVPEFPLPAAALRLVLRNLVANALAAGAEHIEVSATVSADRWTLVVDDDGVGIRSGDQYAAGSRLGLSLCRRLVARFGGALELDSRPGGGARATLAIVAPPRGRQGGGASTSAPETTAAPSPSSPPAATRAVAALSRSASFSASASTSRSSGSSGSLPHTSLMRRSR
jgi:signal transduction histidine kinase